MSEMVTLASLCSKIVDCEHKTAPEASPSEAYGYAVGTPHIRNGRILLDSAKMVSRETYESWTAREVPRDGDLILAREAPVGQVGRVSRGQKICLGQRTVLLRPNPSIADSRYLHYLLLSPAVQDVMRSKSAGSTVAHLNVKDIRDLPLPALPTKAHQEAIAAVLATLDEKIAVNDRIATVALELAEYIYARAAATSDWRALTLKQAAKWRSGGTPRTSESSYWNGTIPWISATSLKDPWIYQSDRMVTELGLQNGTRLARRDSILFVVRGMSLTSEFRVGMAQRDVAFGQDCKELTAIPEVDATTLFLAIKSKERTILDMVDLAGHGTGRLVTDRLAELSIHLPSPGVDTANFAQKIHPIVKRASNARVENSRLSTLRDTLLPQLMSGRLRVRDAEKIVEDHA